MSSSVLKRIEALEAAVIASRHPQLVFTWTSSLAARIEAALPPGHNYELVTIRFPSSEAEEQFEADLRRDNPSEGNRLDALLRGEVHG